MPTMSKTRLYKIWLNMRARCTNENHPDYRNYGGRGITVCPEWLHDYKVFEDWAYTSGYREYLTIDRIDNCAGYSPDNCRWASRYTQTHNRRQATYPLYEIDGIKRTSFEWADIAGITQDTFRARWRAGKRGKELLAPSGNRGPKKTIN